MTQYLVSGEAITVTELKPTDGRKSFYNKAYVRKYQSGKLELESYGKIVAGIENGKFTEYDHFDSQTTQRHIKAFKETYGVA